MGKACVDAISLRQSMVQRQYPARGASAAIRQDAARRYAEGIWRKRPGRRETFVGHSGASWTSDLVGVPFANDPVQKFAMLSRAHHRFDIISI
jgi:hypothetical protein